MKSPFSKINWTQRWTVFRSRLGHAFAVDPPATPLTAEDEALLERVAEAVVRRRMATPTVLFLESAGPMNFLGSQALHFLTPVLDVVFPRQDVERVARLLERRDSLSRLAHLIERRAEMVDVASAR
jgi:hypothetical protein